MAIGATTTAVVCPPRKRLSVMVSVNRAAAVASGPSPPVRDWTAGAREGGGPAGGGGGGRARPACEGLDRRRQEGGGAGVEHGHPERDHAGDEEDGAPFDGAVGLVHADAAGEDDQGGSGERRQRDRHDAGRRQAKREGKDPGGQRSLSATPP